MSWSVPSLWTGRTVVILGGGPSLAAVDLEPFRAAGTGFIACNDAGLVRAPWAEVLFFADPKWPEWNRDELHLFNPNGLLITREPAPAKASVGRDLKIVGREEVLPLSLDRTKVAGPDSGSNSVNLAVLGGGRRIVLLGFDMRPGHWHQRHKEGTSPAVYPRFRTALEKMAPVLSNMGVTVLNATPGSALTCFPIVDPAEVLAG